MMMLNKNAAGASVRLASRPIMARPLIAVVAPVQHATVCQAADYEAMNAKPASPVKVHVSNLSFNLSQDELASEFSRVGEVVGVELWQRDGRPNGMGMIEFSTEDAAASAVEQLNGVMLAGRELRVKIDQGRPARERSFEPRERSPMRESYGGAREYTPRAPRPDAEGRKLFVSNLNYDTDWMSLKSHFESVGVVEHTKVLTDRETGQSRGIGFVEMSSIEEANQAIEALTGTELDGRSINVRISEPRPAGDRPPSENRSYGGGGRGGGYNSGGGRQSYGGGRGRRDSEEY